ncbi:lipopolysaccharide transport periplasmic protein LptA [Thiohalorhabdus methylotrophus]|uniref:Lipopolysaccharide transport periplasmic protein LptA n=1 Tax=Thiohalorhabdus methylotrophus TaxID=3242694 RepID=A0ABV4TRV7_9GAMM
MAPAERLRRLFALLGLAVLPLTLCAAPAAAQEAPAQQGGQSGDGQAQEPPLVVESDEMLIRDARKQAVYTGNVVATKGDMVLHARKVVVDYSEGGLRTVHAYGAPVTMDRGERHGEAREAIYDARKRTVLLIGEAFLEEGPNSLKGARIRYFMGEQRTEVYSGDQEDGQGRARAIFQPGSEPGPQQPGASDQPSQPDDTPADE